MTLTITSRLGAYLTDIGVQPSTKRSDFIEHVAARLVRQSWAAVRGRAPSRSRPLDAADAAVLESLLVPDLAAKMSDASDACERVLALIGALADEFGVRLPWDRVSEATCTRVGRACAADEPLGDLLCHQAAWEVFLIGTSPSKLDRATFEQRYAAAYEVAWQRHGCASVTRWPPSEIGLGLDRRPRLVAPTPGAADWSQGTNRDIYGRYALHTKASARGTVPTCARPGCKSPELAAAEDAGAEEVERACRPYGLDAAAHRVLLRSLALGLEAEPTKRHGWVRWDKWASPCRPFDTTADVDEAVADTACSYLTAWSRGDVGAAMIKQYGMGELLIPLRRTVIRKTWMDAHGFERRYREPMRRCSLPRSMSAALYRTFPVAYRSWLDGRLGDPAVQQLLDPCPDVDTPAPPKPKTGHVATPTERARAERQQRTVELLTAHVALVQEMVGNGSSWRGTYDDLALDEPGAYLSGEDALALLHETIEEMD